MHTFNQSAIIFLRKTIAIVVLMKSEKKMFKTLYTHKHTIHEECILVEYVFIYIDKHPCETVYVRTYIFIFNRDRVRT